MAITASAVDDHNRSSRNNLQALRSRRISDPRTKAPALTAHTIEFSSVNCGSAVVWRAICANPHAPISATSTVRRHVPLAVSAAGHLISQQTARIEMLVTATLTAQ